MRAPAPLAVLVTILAVSSLSAQDVTGNVQGRVLDADGQPAPATDIAVSGAHISGARTATTGTDGFFQILALPPGTYTINVKRIGARPVTIEQLTVEIGRTTSVRAIRLQAEAIALEPLRVTADQLSIDFTRTDIGASLSPKEYAMLPGERDYQSIITLLPHIIDSGRGDPANVGGSTGLENIYFIDGVNVTSQLRGTSGTSIPYNFVRAVEVKTGGYGAQYGKALGAVINAVTYSGTNDFEANAFGFLTTSGLSATPKAEPTLRESSALSYDVGVRVSGPVVRDRLWLAAAVNPRVERVKREIQQHGEYTDRTFAGVFAGKLTWAASRQTNAELALFGDPTVRHAVEVPAVAPAGYAVLNPDPYLVRLKTGGIFGSMRLTSTVSDNLLLEASVTRSSASDDQEGDTEIGGNAPSFVDDITRTVSGGVLNSSISNLTRSTASMRVTITSGPHSFIKAAGHTIVVGAEYENATAARSMENAGGYALTRGTDSVYTATREMFEGTFHNLVPTLYSEDSWRASDAITLNFGLRWSRQTLTGASGKTAQRLKHEWQPRLGVIWQPPSAGHQRLFFSYGRFYQQIPLNLSTLTFVDYVFLTSTFSSDPRDPGVVAETVSDYTTYEKDYANKWGAPEVENFDEFTVGYERLLGTSMKLTARVLHRDLRSSFQMGFDPAHPLFWVIGTPGEGALSFLPTPKRRYTALELSAQGKWQQIDLRTSYVLSRSWGNYTGLYASDMNVANPGIANFFGAPYQATNSEGLLPNDHTHVFKVSGYRPFGFGLTAGAIFNWSSGSPENEFAPGSILRYWRAFAAPRGTAGRTPALWDLNARIAYDLKSASRGYGRVLLDILNIGNPQQVVQREELRYLRNANGVFSDENPSYGTPVRYQRPMMARLGYEITF